MTRYSLIVVMTIFILVLLNLPNTVEKDDKKSRLINLLYKRDTIARLPSYAHYKPKRKAKAK